MGIGSIDNSPTKGFLGDRIPNPIGNGGIGGFVGRGVAGFPSAPFFQVLANGSITPQVGTSGTVTRASTAYFLNTISTITSVTNNVAAAEAYGNITTTTRGGVAIFNAITNLLVQSETFGTTWAAVGTGTVTSNTATAPDGNATADTIAATAAGDGITQASGTAAGSTGYKFYVWLKASTGSRTVRIRIEDQAGSPVGTNNDVTVTTTWQLFGVYQKFSAATGNVVCKILVNDTTGYSIFAWGAQCNIVSTVATNSMMWDSDLYSYVPTVAATASKASDFVSYTGTELTTQKTKLTSVHWYYLPNYQNGQIWNTHFGNCLGHNVNGTLHGFQLSSSTATIRVCYGGNTFVDSTGLGNKAAWNQVVISTDYGKNLNKTFINNVLVHSSSTSQTNFAPQFLALGSMDTSTANSMWNSLIGRTELYAGAAGASDVASLFNAQKGNYGL